MSPAAASPAGPSPFGAGPDPLDASLVRRDTGYPSLHVFNEAGILDSADIHAAMRLGRLAGERDEAVLLAAALAVRAPRMGHVSVDLRQVRSSVVVVGAEDLDLDALPWPDPVPWLAAVAASPLVAAEPAESPATAEPSAITSGSGSVRPLRLVGSSLYLDRYWQDQADVAAGLLARADEGSASPPADAPASGDAAASPAVPDDLLDRLFTDGAGGEQRCAAEAALTRRLAVIAGGPGTGKTTTVARLLVALFEQAEAAGHRPPLVALAAPTGKAAARMEEAVRAETSRVPTSESVRRSLASVRGSTIHRLLGSRPDRVSRFRHHAGHRLPHDVVVIDEASMVSLSLMARLVEAVRTDARLVLVGDPEQLVSVEAGAVLADITGPALDGRSGAPPRPTRPDRTIDGCVVVLRQNHRFSGALADLARAVRAGDGDAAVAILRRGDGGIEWIETEPDSLLADRRRPGEAAAAPEAGGASDPATGWRDGTVRWALELVDRARAADAPGAARVLASHRILCAHRRGGAGVSAWNARVEQWLAAAAPDILGEGPWYAGRPVIVTANDYSIRLFNGDTGVTVAASPGSGSEPLPEHPAPEHRAPDHPAPDQPAPDHRAPDHPAPDQAGGRLPAVAFEGPGGEVRTISPYRLAQVETVFAMTVHKSQGSEFDRVSVLLPPATSRLLTRELLYTAFTRARSELVVVGSEDALRAAVERPMERASGLGPMLWGETQ